MLLRLLKDFEDFFGGILLKLDTYPVEIKLNPEAKI